MSAVRVVRRCCGPNRSSAAAATASLAVDAGITSASPPLLSTVAPVSGSPTTIETAPPANAGSASLGASIAARPRYGFISPPGRRFSIRALFPLPTSRTAVVRLSMPQATEVGANEPFTKRL